MIGLNPTADIEASTMAAKSVNYLAGARPASRAESTGAKMAAEAIGAANDGIMGVKKVAKLGRLPEPVKIAALGLGGGCSCRFDVYKHFFA
ncbi:unnamed protein product [Sphagnum jensenii]|uniref:Uncharacterized protein n=2 Tax=Sphagnum jensenii TaxID=128206 RepID=A0ABP0VHD2_9BRYO